MAVNFYHSSFLCCYGYSCGVLSAIHLDLWCTHTRRSDPCLSTIDPQSPVHFTSVTALYRVQCGSFNHALSGLKRRLWYGTHFLYALFVCAMHYDSKNLYYTWISRFSINLISSTFRFIMGLVLILLMNSYCNLRVKLQIPPLQG